MWFLRERFHHLCKLESLSQTVWHLSIQILHIDICSKNLCTMIALWMFVELLSINASVLADYTTKQHINFFYSFWSLNRIVYIANTSSRIFIEITHEKVHSEYRKRNLSVLVLIAVDSIVTCVKVCGLKNWNEIFTQQKLKKENLIYLRVFLRLDLGTFIKQIFVKINTIYFVHTFVYIVFRLNREYRRLAVKAPGV